MMMTKKTNGYEWFDDGNEYCSWKEIPGKKILGKKLDWFEPSCQARPVNPLSVASKRGITVVDIFKKCPFCERPVATFLKDGKRLVPAK